MKSFDKKYEDNTITEEELKIYKNTFWVKKWILEAIYLFMIVFSFVRIYRINIFFNVLGGGGFSFYAIAIVLYYLTLVLFFAYNSFQLGYMIYFEIKHLDWLKLIHKLTIKLDITSFLCKCLSILLFIMIYITTPCTVVGQSMEQTFHEGDRLLCTDLFYNPKKGDVVVFDAKRYTTDESFYIKRVVAVAGDKVTYSLEAISTYINNIEYKDITLDNFTTMKNKLPNKVIEEYSFTVPDGMIMVLGDNRGHSYDSRKFGLIYQEDVFGRVYIRLFPFNGISFY